MTDSAQRPPRFLADDNLQKAIVDGMRRKRPNITFLMLREAGTLGLGDPDILQRARELDLLLVSHDRRTMYRHFADALAQLPNGEHMPGVFLVSQDKFSVGQIIGFLLEIYDLSSHDEWQDRIINLPL